MTEYEIRQAIPEDLDQVIALLRETMQRGDDARFIELFRWKHLDNAFGLSPAWVALDGDRIIAARYFMRWEFERREVRYRAVRAVDTATHPDYQGKGLFRQLTLGAIDDLTTNGVDFIFNTPNDQSRPGYLKMGWQLVGVLGVHGRPTSLRGVVKMATSRVAADHFSLDTTAGDPALVVLGDNDFIVQLLSELEPSDQLRTPQSPDVLRWRFGSELLKYRVAVHRDGIGIFRIRQRGAARELAITAILTSKGVGGTRAITQAVLRCAKGQADYAVCLGKKLMPSFFALPKVGPTLAWRALNDTVMTPLDGWSLTLGDIELF